MKDSDRIEEAADDENEITECPNCQRGYDDADRDFLICHWCGYDVEKGRVDSRKATSSTSEKMNEGGFIAGWDY